VIPENTSFVEVKIEKYTFGMGRMKITPRGTSEATNISRVLVILHSESHSSSFNHRDGGDFCAYKEQTTVGE
jgi:hypothetical protein